MKLLAMVLLAAAVLKGRQLLTEPVLSSTIWSSRPFLIFLVEFELALGLWFLSGLFKKAAWLTAWLCFSVFSVVTLYKGLTGAASCGCFGQVHVNPWITLFAIDLPAVIALTVFRPRLSLPLAPLPSLGEPESVKAVVRQLLGPMPSRTRLAVVACLLGGILAVTTTVLAFGEPPAITSSYEVLEPETWVGKRLPILEYIDISRRLEKGNWLILFHRHDCPDCARAIAGYEQMARDLAANEDLLQIALIEVPPFGRDRVRKNSSCLLGRLTEEKEWFITTPAVVLLTDRRVKSAWEAEAPDLQTIMRKIAPVALENRKRRVSQVLDITAFVSKIAGYG